MTAARSALGTATASLLAGWLAAWSSLWYQTADFFCFWTGGRFVLSGRDPYDERAWAAATAGLFPDPRGFLAPASCPGRFAYPYWTAIALAPFGAMPLELAATLWMAINIAAAVGGTLLAWRVAAGGPGRAFLVALVLSSQPFWTLLASGQFSGLMLAIAGAIAWALARGLDGGAGVALAALLLKPQLGAFVIPAVIVDATLRRRARVLVAWLASAAVLTIVSLALAPGWIGGWLGEIATRRVGETAIRPSAWGLSLHLFGDALWGAAVLAALVVAIALLARGEALKPVALVSLGIAISLLVTPYVSVYDYLVLALPWALIAAKAWRAEGARRALLLGGLIASASALSWLLFAVWQLGGSQTWSALVPMTCALLLAWSLRVAPARA